MTLYFEIILLSLTYVCIGYVVARPKLWVISLGIILWVVSGFSTYFIKKTPVIPQITAECMTIPNFSALIIVLIIGTIFYGSSFLIGYYIGTIVNNVEKYQRKECIITILL